MNSEQEKGLLDYLASLGFAGEKFTAQLQEKLKLNTPNFIVPDKIAFGEEQMFLSCTSSETSSSMPIVCNVTRRHTGHLCCRNIQ